MNEQNENLPETDEEQYSLEEEQFYPERRTRPVIVIVLIITLLVGIGSGIYLTWLHFRAGGSFCDINETLNCSAVATGPFSSILGIPVAHYGVLTYLVCMILTILGTNPHKNRFRAHVPLYLLAISIWCVLFSIFLALVSTFMIEAHCIFCMTLYGVNLVFLILSIIWTVDVPKGRFKSLLSDIYTGVGMVRVWIAAGVVVLVLVGSGVGFSFIEPRVIKGPEAVGFDFSDNPWKGPLDAPVQVITVSDPKCPWCARAHDVIMEARERYGDKFYVIFNHYPLDKTCNTELSRTLYEGACNGSQASYCAQRQSMDKFWEYMDYLFEHRKEDWTIEVLISYAEKLELDTDKFRKCMNDPAAMAVIKQDIRDGRKNKVNSTPTIFFNGQAYGNAATNTREFLSTLQKVIAADKRASTPATGERTVIPEK